MGAGDSSGLRMVSCCISRAVPSVGRGSSGGDSPLCGLTCPLYPGLGLTLKAVLPTPFVRMLWL